jgi:hypothetical protein
MEWGLTFEEIEKVYLDLVRYRHTEYIEVTNGKQILLSMAPIPPI